MFGVDISTWNGSNDFYRAKNDGVKYVIIRSNYGYSDYGFQMKGYDNYFDENYSRAKNAGLPIGVYCYNYSQTIEQAREEARRTLKCLNGKTVDIAVFCDAEDSYFLKGDDITDKIIAYLEVIKSAGYPIGVYANLNWFTNYIDLDRIKNKLGDVVTWIAHYNSNLYNGNPNHYKGSYDIWQYGSEGYTVDGISNYGSGIAYVDVNHSYRDFTKKAKTGWIKNDVGWWYRYADGSYPVNKWVLINKNWFYFDENGYALQNRWLKYKDEWYYFGEDGSMLSNQFTTIGSETFYLNSWGVCDLNYVREIDGRLYAFNDRGALIKDKVIDKDGVIE